MNDSTRRSLRTAYQFLVACIGIVPVLLTIVPHTSPLAARLAVVLVGLTAASKIINSLEDHNLIPAWLKTTPVDLNVPVVIAVNPETSIPVVPSEPVVPPVA